MSPLDILHLSGNFQAVKETNCDCPVPCDTISFKPILSYAAFPSNGYVSRYVETIGKSITPDDVKQIQEKLRYLYLLVNTAVSVW